VQTQIPCGNDNKKSKCEAGSLRECQQERQVRKQIPCGNDNTKSKGKAGRSGTRSRTWC